MAMFQLFGKSTDPKTPSSEVPAEEPAIAVIESPPPPREPSSRPTDTERVAEDPKLASLLQRIQQLTAAPEPGTPPPEEHRAAEIANVEPQASVSVPTAQQGQRDDYIP